MGLSVQPDCVNRLPIELILPYGFATRKPAITRPPKAIARTALFEKVGPAKVLTGDFFRFASRPHQGPAHIPITIFGDNIPRIEARRRYELLFGLLLNSGLRISEALGLAANRRLA